MSNHSSAGMLLCDRIRFARRRSGLTQSLLAKRIGVGPSAVAQWEVPSGTTPAVANLMKMATTCGVSLEWLATGRGGAVLADLAIHEMGNQEPRDLLEERLLVVFNRIAAKQREAFVRWLEEFL